MTPQPIIAVDPGVNGGIAYWQQPLSGKPVTDAYNMPDTEADIKSLFLELAQPGEARFVIEQVGGFTGGKGQPGSRMFTFGRNFGVLLGMAIAFGWRIELVRPQKWQAALSLGTSSGVEKNKWKNKLKSEAQRLYPDLTVTLKTADALLILEYARRTALGNNQ